jgi:hypothetical protein
MQTIHATARSGAPPQTVWALLADVETWPQWAAFDAAELEQPGSPDPHGLDAIRRFRRGRHTTRERVTAFEPARRSATCSSRASRSANTAPTSHSSRRTGGTHYLAIEPPRQVPSVGDERPEPALDEAGGNGALTYLTRGRDCVACSDTRVSSQLSPKTV